MREQNQKSTDTFTTTRPRDNVSLPILKYKWGGGDKSSVYQWVSAHPCVLGPVPEKAEGATGGLKDLRTREPPNCFRVSLKSIED